MSGSWILRPSQTASNRHFIQPLSQPQLLRQVAITIIGTKTNYHNSTNNTKNSTSSSKKHSSYKPSLTWQQQPEPQQLQRQPLALPQQPQEKLLPRTSVSYYTVWGPYVVAEGYLSSWGNWDAANRITFPHKLYFLIKDTCSHNHQAVTRCVSINSFFDTHFELL